MKWLFKSSDGDLRCGWKAAALILGTILSGILLNTIIVTAMAMGLAWQGFTQEQALEKAMAASGSFIAQVVLSVLQLGVMLWLVRWLVRKVEKETFSWTALGLTADNRQKHIVNGAFLGIVICLAILVIGNGFGALAYLGNGVELFGLSQTAVTISLAAVLALASGFGEEIAFRGYLQSILTRRYNSVIAILLTAFLFALSHPLGNPSHPLLYLLTASLVGILFGVLFVRTGSLWMGISLHAVWNYLQIAVLAVRGGADERFFGAPLFVFENVSGVPHLIVECGVISLVLLSVLWFTRPVLKRHSRLSKST